MSVFFRQLNIVSSLKSGSDSDKILPFYKALAPALSCDGGVRTLHTEVLTKNLQLKQPKLVESEQKSGSKRLTIILSWLLAKGSHMEKYSKVYLSRGFDVLTVNITPHQMLFPIPGSQVVAENVLEFVESNKQYEEIIVHAFSVGGYLMGEIFLKCKQSEKYKDFPKRVKGFILDSGVDFEGIATGFPRAVVKSPVLVRGLELFIKSHMSLMYNVATKHYMKSSKAFHDTLLSCPALFLVSEADKVGTPKQNRNLADSWEKKGVDISFKVWEKSLHVSHMHLYKEEYLAEINKFLHKIDLDKG